MEIELKYKLLSHLLADKIWKDFGGQGVGCKYSGAYYDTPDMGLAKKDVIFRIRSEEEACIATMKWNAVEDFGLYEREEVDVNLGPNPPNQIDREIFRGTKAFDIVSDISGDLLQCINVDFIRRKKVVSFGQSLVELAIDMGNITAGKGKSPICELEIELKEGNKEDLVALGKEIVEKYSLEPEKSSKFARGKKLLNEEI